jgi:hypothetical protein
MTPVRTWRVSGPFLRILVAAAAVAGCVTPSPPPREIAYEGPRFTGEVVAWDESQSIVTLRTVDGQIRVRVHPDDLARLKPRATVTLTGELVLPADVTILPGQATFTPVGPEDLSQLTARIVAVDIQGKITVETERGPTDVWVTNATEYNFGDPVQIRIVVRNGKVEPTPGEAVPAKAPERKWTEPGDHAIVVGRVLSVDPRGVIVVDSPRGPIRVWVTPKSDRYLAGEFVEVRTRVRHQPQPARS